MDFPAGRKQNQDHFPRAVGCNSHISVFAVSQADVAQHGSLFNEPKRLGGFPPQQAAQQNHRFAAVDDLS